MLCGHVMAMRISTHALREVGDALPARRRWSGSYFYPRPPRGGRPVRNSPQLPSAHISIHALREEGD